MTISAETLDVGKQLALVIFGGFAIQLFNFLTKRRELNQENRKMDDSVANALRAELVTHTQEMRKEMLQVKEENANIRAENLSMLKASIEAERKYQNMEFERNEIKRAYEDLNKAYAQAKIEYEASKARLETQSLNLANDYQRVSAELKSLRESHKCLVTEVYSSNKETTTP